MARLAIPIWNKSVSTTFDFARQLVVADVSAGRKVSQRVLPIQAETITGKARVLEALSVDVLICGAISQPLGELIARHGIRIVPCITGPVNSVIAAYMNGGLGDPAFLLAGSPPGARRRWRHGRSGTGSW